MSYFNRVKVEDWTVKGAIQYFEEAKANVDKVPLQLVLDDLNNVMKGARAGKKEAAVKFLRTMHENMEGETRQVMGGSVSVGSISVGTLVDASESGTINYNFNGGQESFACDLSPIPSNNESKDLYNSFLSDSYHPNRTNVHFYETIEAWPSCTTRWMIDDFDVIAGLKAFWDVSSHLATTQGNISDTRILALHRVFPFLINQNDSITLYIGHHDEIFDEIKLLTSGCPPVSSDLILWCYSLATSTDKLAMMKKKCFKIMDLAYEKGNETDILATSILFNIAPRIARNHDSYMIEDTFVHLYFDSLLGDLFSTEEIFYQSWANSTLESSSSTKPDWLNYIRPWYTKIDITTYEVKPPSKQGNSDQSDFVKLGLEMRRMVNKMLDVIKVEDAMVFGILVEGYHVTTYAMDLKAEVYRMMQLGKCNLMSQQCDLKSFPVLFHCLLQVKTLAATVANKIKEAQIAKANGKRNITPGPTWRSDDLMKTTKKKRQSEGSCN
ncbi:hypothetical protein BC941DRAFT_448851 [Chlamydoabsidia padenii]|nr:hypothetical protein BC941DRAFT_448851 [Chlamydoabsidia padenii]